MPSSLHSFGVKYIFSHLLYMSPTLNWFDLLRWRAETFKLLPLQSSPGSCCFMPLRKVYSPQNPVLKCPLFIVNRVLWDKFLFTSINVKIQGRRNCATYGTFCISGSAGLYGNKSRPSLTINYKINAKILVYCKHSKQKVSGSNLADVLPNSQTFWIE